MLFHKVDTPSKHFILKYFVFLLGSKPSMTLIDGVGDEVVQFIAVVLVVVVAALAWLSTNARPDQYQTVLVMRSRTHHPVTVSIRTSKYIKPLFYYET